MVRSPDILQHVNVIAEPRAAADIDSCERAAFYGRRAQSSETSTSFALNPIHPIAEVE